MWQQFIKDARLTVDAAIDMTEEAHIDLINSIYKGVEDVAAGQGIDLGFTRGRAKDIAPLYNLVRTVTSVSGELAETLASEEAKANLKILRRLLDYRLTWDELDIDFKPYEATFKTGVPIRSAREAAIEIEDGATVFGTGFGAHGRNSIFYRAVRETYKSEGAPHSLRWMGVSGQGGRGVAPATLEEVGQEGLITEYVSGHIETVKSLLKLGQQGKLEIHTLPQGVYTELMVEQGKNGTGDDDKSHVLSEIGVGTFMDTRQGPGSAVTPGPSKYAQYDEESGKIDYSLPKIDVALLSVPYVDFEGNVYFKDSSIITECLEAAAAAKKNGGKVFVTTGRIIEKDEEAISIPGTDIDVLVFNPKHEQVAGVLQDNFWPMFTANREKDVDIAESMQRVRLINTIMGITPHRRTIDNAIARLAGRLFVENTKPGAVINLGIGLPEEVGRLLYEGGLHDTITFTTESGAYGGIPTPGIFFGGAINPERIESSAWMFNLYKTGLDLTVLGFLQVDSEGNVNVSKRGEKVTDSIGPGGFMDIAAGADTVIFMGSWTVQGKVATSGGKVRIQQAGQRKFVDKVRQVTFSGKAALEAGKTVYYVTDVGMFQLLPEGLTLQAVWPGIDVERDVFGNSDAKIIVSPGGPAILDAELITGDGYQLAWPPTKLDPGAGKKKSKQAEKASGAAKSKAAPAPKAATGS